jgi:hypothetical protein
MLSEMPYDEVDEARIHGELEPGDVALILDSP